MLISGSLLPLGVLFSIFTIWHALNNNAIPSSSRRRAATRSAADRAALQPLARLSACRPACRSAHQQIQRPTVPPLSTHSFRHRSRYRLHPFPPSGTLSLEPWSCSLPIQSLGGVAGIVRYRSPSLPSFRAASATMPPAQRHTTAAQTSSGSGPASG